VLEELSAVIAVRQQQLEVVRQFEQIGKAITFSVNHLSHKQQDDFELGLRTSINRTLSKEILSFQDLLRTLETLERKARWRIDVKEEDNSKTIFVFTVVTSLFLPLSFVSSYLGMNTTDIRTMDNSQATFWATALPVTVSVVALAVLAANRGDAARDWFFGKRQRLRQRRIRAPKEDRLYDTSASDAHTDDEHRKVTRFSRRRLRRSANSALDLEPGPT
jgi:hypothetical protein